MSEQEIKPIGFLANDSITGKPFYVPAEANYGVGRTPLYALPATHRIVPVSWMQDVEQSLSIILHNAKDNTAKAAVIAIHNELRAIINKEPT